MIPRFDAIVEHSSDVISLVNPKGDFLYTSRSSAAVLGYQPGELNGTNTFDLFHPEDLDGSRKAMEELLRKPPGPNHFEARVRQKDGCWVWVESTITNLLDEPSVGAIVVNYREIRAREKADKLRLKRREELLRSNAALEDFGYAVAHDLRESLRTISMFTEVLINDENLGETGRKQGQFIVEAVGRMSALFEGLQTFAMHGFEEAAEVCDLNTIIPDSVANLGQAIADSHATIVVDPLPEVQAYPIQLVRVFQNLIANAIKYRSGRPPEIRISAERRGTEWLLKVSDNGIGIEPQHQALIFGIMKRLHGREIPGAGFGLAMCRKIIEAGGGTIWVESTPGAGSTFYLTLEAAHASPVLAIPKPVTRLSHEKRARRA